MATKKKHLKYRATKGNSIGTQQLNTQKVVLPPKQKSPVSTKSASEKSPDLHTRLTPDQQIIVKRELWHIAAIAVGILVLYGIFWIGFTYGGWSETILRYIPHGQ